MLAGQAGRDIRWSLNTARTGFSHGVEVHLSKSGLRASATLSIGTDHAAFQRDPIFIQGRCAAGAGRFSRTLRAVISAEDRAGS